MARRVRFNWFGASVQSRIAANADRNVKIAAQFLKRDIQKSMKRGGGGFRAKKARGTVRRSRPGQVPFVQTGRLRQSIFTRKISRGVYWVGTNLDYGIFHELGIRYRRKGIQKRPFIKPAVDRNKRKLENILRTGLV